MDETLRTSPREFQDISKRIIVAFYPKRERIPNAGELRKTITEGMRETGSYRSAGYLKGRGPELVFELAQEEKKWAQVLLGWIKPWQKPVLKVKPPVREWRIVGVRRLIREFEQKIIHYRHELRKLGLKLKPYSAKRIRRLEQEFLSDIGWKEQKKKYWWAK